LFEAARSRLGAIDDVEQEAIRRALATNIEIKAPLREVILDRCTKAASYW
jgi:hypothetical protein